MRWMTGMGLLAGLMVLPSTALAGEARGLELGLRLGYAFPIGSAAGSSDGSPSVNLSAVYNGAVPIWIDAGYRWPHLFVGGFFQYGVGLVNTSNTSSSSGCNASGVSCTGNVLMFGADVAYHILPGAGIDPWIGAGVGYEIANVSVSEGGSSASLGLSGVQFLNLQAGADYKPLENLGIGPFVMLSLDEYSSCSESGVGETGSCTINSKAVHGWITLGVRGAFDINL